MCYCFFLLGIISEYNFELDILFTLIKENLLQTNRMLWTKLVMVSLFIVNHDYFVIDVMYLIESVVEIVCTTTEQRVNEVRKTFASCSIAFASCAKAFHLAIKCIFINFLWWPLLEVKNKKTGQKGKQPSHRDNFLHHRLTA